MNVKAFLIYLLKQGILTNEQVQKSIRYASSQNKQFGVSLVQLGFFTKESLKETIEEFNVYNSALHSKTKTAPLKVSDLAKQNPQEFQKEGEKLLTEISKFTKGHPSGETLKLPSHSTTNIETIQILPETHVSKTHNIPDENTEPFMSLPTGERYQTLSTLGEGGMGVVQLVYDQILGRELALKTLRTVQTKEKTNSSQQDTLLWRLSQEAAITAVLEHPNIIPLYNVEKKASGEIFFTMRRIDGDTLTALLKKMQTSEKQFDEDQLLAIFFKVCDAVAYAHAQGVIHRDLKPENIMVGQFGEVYVMDWGIAKKIATTTTKEETEDESNKDSRISPFFESSSELCQTIGGMGTPGYMSPEQASEANLATVQSDIYSLGKILRQCFIFLSPAEELKKEISSARRQRKLTKYKMELKETVVDDSIPPDIRAIVQKATSSVSNERYESVLEMVADIDRYQKNVQISVRRYSPLERFSKWRKRNWKSLSIGFGLIFFLFCCIFFYQYVQVRDRKQQFLTLFQKSVALNQAIEKKSQTENLGQQISSFLDVLNLINNALKLMPDNQEAQEKKLKITEQLVKLACSSLDYQVADYVTNNLKGTSPLQLSKKRELESFIQQEKNKVLKQHQERLKYWIEAFAQKDLDENSSEDAIFEISKMPEKEIFNELLAIAEKAHNSFYHKSSRTFRQKKFYFTIITALGRLGNTDAAPRLLTYLKEMCDNLAPLKNRAGNELDYMIVLATAIGNLKVTQLEKPFQNVRERMGQNNLFWVRTRMAHRKLLRNEKRVEGNNAQAFFEEGNLKTNLKKYKAAILDYTQAINLDPEFFPAYVHRGLAKVEKGDLTGALKDYQKALQINPNTPTVLINRGNLKVKLGKLNEAMIDYNLALEIDPWFLTAYENRGHIKRETKDLIGALNDFKKILEINPSYASAYSHCAGVKHLQGNIKGAIEDYDKSLQLNPDSDITYNHRGLAKKELGDFEGAILDFTKAIQLNASEAKYYANRALTKEMKGNINGALQDYKLAIQLAPTLLSLYKNRAILYFNIGEKAKALADLNYVLEKDPKNWKAYRERGLFKKDTGDFKGAIKDFTFMIQESPRNSEGYFNRGVVHQMQYHFEKAIADYTDAIALEPDKANYYTNRGAAKRSIKNYKEALVDFQKVVELTPKVHTAYSNRAAIKMALGDLKGAFDDYTTSIQRKETSSSYFFRGLIQEKQQHYQKAIEDYNQSLALKTDSPQSLEHLGRCYLKIGEQNLAITSFQKSLRFRENQEITGMLLKEIEERIKENKNKEKYQIVLQDLRLFQKYAKTSHPNFLEMLQLEETIKKKLKENIEKK